MLNVLARWVSDRANDGTGYVRVNIDSQVVTDARFKRLGRALRISWFEALGRCTVVWLESYARRAELLIEEDIDIIADMDGFARALVAAELAELGGDNLIRLRGVSSRITFLIEQQERSKKAVAARTRRSQSASEWGLCPATADSGGKDRCGEPAANVGKQSRLPNPPSGQPCGEPYGEPNGPPHDTPNGQSYGSPNSPDLDQDHDQDQRERERARDPLTRPTQSGAPASSLSLIPSGWVPERDPETTALEAKRKWDGVNVDAALVSFTDKMRSKGLKSAQWTAEWRNWLRRERPAKEPSGSSQTRPQPRAFSPQPIVHHTDEERAELMRMAADVAESLGSKPKSPFVMDGGFADEDGSDFE